MTAPRILATTLAGALVCSCARAPERYACEPAIDETVTAHAVPSSAAVAAATLDSTGHRSLVVLSLRSAAEAQRCSNELLDAGIFTDARSVEAYFPEAAYGLASISGVVSGPYTITVGTTCDGKGWGAQADAAAVSAA